MTENGRSASWLYRSCHDPEILASWMTCARITATCPEVRSGRGYRRTWSSTGSIGSRSFGRRAAASPRCADRTRTCSAESGNRSAAATYAILRLAVIGGVVGHHLSDYGRPARMQSGRSLPSHRPVGAIGLMMRWASALACRLRSIRRDSRRPEGLCMNTILSMRRI